jgi:hypothetical protein
MKKIKIDVHNGLACDKNRYYATACSGRFTVVKFDFWGDSWFFNTNEILGFHGGYATGITISGQEFPLDVFKTICQASCLLHLHLSEFPEIELTARAKKLLKIN